jgi:hypothetical protein
MILNMIIMMSDVQNGLLMHITVPITWETAGLFTTLMEQLLTRFNSNFAPTSYKLITMKVKKKKRYFGTGKYKISAIRFS